MIGNLKRAIAGILFTVNFYLSFSIANVASNPIHAAMASRCESTCDNIEGKSLETMNVLVRTEKRSQSVEFLLVLFCIQLIIQV